MPVGGSRRVSFPEGSDDSSQRDGRKSKESGPHIEGKVWITVVFRWTDVLGGRVMFLIVCCSVVFLTIVGTNV